MNLIRQLGAFTFASRLMRLSERLKSDVSTVYHSCGMDFDDHWFLVGYMLSEKSSMAVAARRFAPACHSPSPGTSDE